MLLARPFGQKVKYRISGMEAFFYIFAAITFDIFTLIPFSGTVIGWIFWFLFYFWLIFIRGIGLNRSRLVAGGISSFAELLPLVQALPTITLGVVRVIISTRKEDAEKYLSQRKKSSEPAKPEEDQPEGEEEAAASVQ